MRTEEIKRHKKVTNDQVLKLIGEKSGLLNNIQRINVNLIGDILRRNCVIHDARWTYDG